MKIKTLFLVLLVGMISCVNAQNGGLKKGDVSPGFNYQDINGKYVNLENLKGKYVYIDIWATWCPPCNAEIPYLKELEKKMHGKNIEFVSISVDDRVSDWKNKVNHEKLKGIQLNYKKDDAFLRAYNVRGIPRFILLDKEGKIVNPDMTRPSNSSTYKFLSELKGI